MISAHADPVVAEHLLGPAKPEETPDPGLLPSTFREKARNPKLQDDIRRAAWARRTAGWMLLSTGLIWGTAAVSWVFYIMTPKIKPVSFDGGHTLREATQAWLGSGIQPNFDQLNLFLHTTLTSLYDFTPAGADFRPFIKGLVAPSIIQTADSAFARDLEVIRSRGVRQKLRLSVINPAEVVFDADSKRVSVKVHGTFELSFDLDPARGVMSIPYSAKVILTPNTPSGVNPFPFFMAEIGRFDDQNKSQ
jgi:hypothetical protein